MGKPEHDPEPLRGCHVLVTRPQAQAGPLAAAIRAAGGVPVLFPAIEIEPPRDREAAVRALEGLAGYGLVVFVSANAVHGARDLAPGSTLPGPAVAGPTMVAVGAATRRALEAAGAGPILTPAQRYDSEGVLALPELATERVGQRAVLLVRGEGGRGLLAEELRRRGARLTEVAVYRRAPAPGDPAPVRAALASGRVRVAVVTSGEGLRNLFAAVGGSGDEAAMAALRCAVLVVTSDRVAGIARELGATGALLVAERADDAAVVEALVRHRLHDSGD